jgi:hypothetical protein
LAGGLAEKRRATFGQKARDFGVERAEVDDAAGVFGREAVRLQAQVLQARVMPTVDAIDCSSRHIVAHVIAKTTPLQQQWEDELSAAAAGKGRVKYLVVDARLHEAERVDVGEQMTAHLERPHELHNLGHVRQPAQERPGFK